MVRDYILIQGIILFVALSVLSMNPDCRYPDPEDGSTGRMKTVGLSKCQTKYAKRQGRAHQQHMGEAGDVDAFVKYVHTTDDIQGIGFGLNSENGLTPFGFGRVTGHGQGRQPVLKWPFGILTSENICFYL